MNLRLLKILMAQGLMLAMSCGSLALAQENSYALPGSASSVSPATGSAPIVEVPQPLPLAVSEFPLTVIDPTAANNLTGSSFPGYRGSNQLVLYDASYGKPRTGTNEFGFEVTVIRDRVIEQEGSDSWIPLQNGYVLSGHGKARQWLIDHAPLGARIQIDPVNQVVHSTITIDTYYYQLISRLDRLKDVVSPVVAGQAQGVLRTLQSLPPEQAVAKANQALEQLNHAAWRSYHIFPDPAIRGVWHRPVETSSETVGHTLDQLKAAGLNTVFLETFFHGYTIFPSKTYQEAGLTEFQNPKFAGWDPLAVWVKEAHHRGMKLHVWFQSFYLGTDTFHGPGPILSKYPQWANVQYSALGNISAVISAAAAKDALTANALAPSNAAKSSNNALAKTNVSAATNAPVLGSSIPKGLISGVSQVKPTPSTLEMGAYFGDQANPDAQEFLLKLAEEIVTRYDIDGFQWDYMDYPLSFPPDRANYLKTTWGYTSIARQKFVAQTGVDPIALTPDQTELWQAWSAFKEAQVNEFMMRGYQRLHNRRPTLQISATAFAKLLESKIKKHEDWALWAQQGWVDFLAPMLLTSSVKVVGQDTTFVIEHSENKVPVMAGIFGPFNGSGPDLVMDQILEAYKHGAAGFSLFDTAHLKESHRVALQEAFSKPNNQVKH